MNDKESGDMDPDSLLNQLLSQDQPQYKHSAGQLNIKNIRERFLNALKEVSRLEKVLEEKNTLLATSAKEKERLIHAINKAFEDKKRLHDRLADFDIVRNMEIAELRQGVEEIMSGRHRLLKENEDIVEDIFERDKTIDELRYTIEKKELQLQEVQTDLYTAIETMRDIESKYKDMETQYKVIEQEKNILKEKLDAAVGVEKQEGPEETEEYRRLLEISTSEKEALERQLSWLRQQRAIDISEYQSMVAETKDLNLKLTEAERELSLLKEENAAGEILKEVEERYNDLEVKYKLIEGERDGLKEKLSRMENEISLLSSLLSESEKEKESFNTERVSFGKTLELKDKEIEDLKSQFNADIIKHISEKERLIYEKVELEESVREIREELERKDKNISELGEQTDKDISERQVAIERLTAERNEINHKLGEVNKEFILLEEKSAATLREFESGYNALKENYKAIESERDALKEKLNIMARELAQRADVENEYRSRIEALNNVISDLKAMTERKADENIALKNDIELLNKQIKENQEKTKEYLEVILSEMRAKKGADEGMDNKESSPDKKLIFLKDERSRDTGMEHPGKMIYVEPPRSRWIKKIAIGIIVLVILGIAGMFLVDRLNTDKISIQKPVSPPASQKTLWLEGSRQVNIKDFIITVTFLTPELMESLGMSSKISQEGMLKNYYYLLELKAEKGCIPDGFVDSLGDKVSFISGSDTLIKSKREFSAERAVIYSADACDGEPGIISSKCVMYIEKEYNPQGIVVEGVAKDSPVVIR